MFSILWSTLSEKRLKTVKTYTVKELASRCCRIHKDLLPYIIKRYLYSSLSDLIPFKYVNSNNKVVEVNTVSDLDGVIREVISFVRANNSLTHSKEAIATSS